MPTFTINLIEILVLFGAGQGLILAYILVSTKRFRKKSNYFLALLLFTLGILNFTSIFEYSPNRDTLELFRYIPTFWVTMIPAATYFFIKYLISPTYQWKKTDWLFFVPFFIEFGHRLYRFGRFLNGNLYTEEENLRYYFMSNIYESVAIIASITVIVYSVKALKRYEVQLYQNYSEVEDKSLKWLRTTLMSGLLLCALWGFLTIMDFDFNSSYRLLALVLLLGLSILIYYTGYSMIIRQDLLDTSVFAVANKDAKVELAESSNITELSHKTDEHFRKIKELFEQEKLYQDPSLNMSMLSDKTGLSNGYLSQIINQKNNLNFFDFVNSYRVEDVKKKMSEPDYEHYTLLGLAQEAGFKSKSTFNSVFKKMTGKTPSEYRKSL